MNNRTRRDFIKTAGGLAAAGFASTMPFARSAHGAAPLVAVEWGPPYIDNTKTVLENWDGGDIVWELHQGGAAAILGKIKASWPNTKYDVIDMWAPVFVSMMKEGWSEPLTVENIPNLADVPEALITKDADGNFMCAPRSVNYAHFAVRADTVPIDIQHIDDLLDPKLKGQIAWPSPILNTSLQVVAMALAKGGDEFNPDPGWDMLKEIARAGNIGRIVHTTTDIINTLSSGETSVTFADLGTLSGVAKHFPVHYLTKTDDSIKSFPAVEGWVVMSNSEQKEKAYDFINFLLSPEAATTYNQLNQLPPASSKATPADGLDHVIFSNEELERFAHIPDYDYVSKQVDAWVKRFEAEIVPLL